MTQKIMSKQQLKELGISENVTSTKDSRSGKVSVLSKEDPYTSRNEFKPGFYDQKDKPPVDYKTMYGDKGKPSDQYTDAMGSVALPEGFVEGGMSRGQKEIQVKKVPFKGIF
jgi:hypothetical protein